MIMMLGLCIAFAGASSASGQTLPLLSIEDSIELTRPGMYGAYESPDGKFFVTLLTQGNIKRNTREYRLVLFSSSEVRAFVNNEADASHPNPQTLVTVSVSEGDEGGGFGKIIWSPDSRCVYFIAPGSDGAGTNQVFRTSIDTRITEQLTRSPEDIIDFSVAASGSAIAAVTQAPRLRYGEGSGGYVVREQLWSAIEQVDRQFSPAHSYVLRDLSRQTQLVVPIAAGVPPRVPVISPDGRWAVVSRPVRPSSGWEKYPEISRSRQIGSYLMASGDVTQLMLVDMRTGRMRPLFDAPIVNLQSIPDRFEWIAWSPRGDRIALAQSFIPTQEPAREPPGMVTVTIPGGEVERIPNVSDVSNIAWSEAGLAVASEGTDYLYARRNGRWALVSKKKRDGLDIYVREAFTGDEFAARDRTTDRSRVFTSLNGDLASRYALPTVREMEWADRLGRIWSGALAMPPGYDSRKRYPLAIGTKGSTSPKFDIGSVNAIPARELVNRGILFLQVSCEFGHRGTPARFELDPEYGPNRSASICYDAAIESLAEQGVIDPTRVGILGFSSSGGIIQYALTHSEHVYAAASIVDSVQWTPFGYVSFFDGVAGTNLRTLEAQQQLDGPPFGERGLSDWFRKSPFFSLDRIWTPIRFEYHGKTSLLFAWDTFAILRRMGRPVELVHFPMGAHDLQLPSDIRASQEQIADWFDFWLQDREDDASEKQDQYQRWRQLRAQLQAVRAGSRPPLRRWTAQPLTGSQ